MSLPKTAGPSEGFLSRRSMKTMNGATLERKMRSIQGRVSLVCTVVLALALAVSCDGYPTEPRGDATEGAAAPTFRLPSAQGGTVSLADFRNKKDVLLYFSMGPG